MAAETAVVSAELFLTQGSCRVYTADTIAGTLSWTERPYLWCDALALYAAPQIDQATLSYEYGAFDIRERTMFNGDGQSGTFAPLELDNMFVKIEILSGDAEAQYQTVDEAEILYTWYGIVEAEEREHAKENDTTAAKRGTQQFYALGLLRLLEREIIKSSFVEDTDDGDPMEIGRGIGFNIPDVGIQEKRGNRSANGATSGEGYVFSFWPSIEADPDEVTQVWYADQALEYLLERHEPTDDLGDPLGNWSRAGDVIDWYDITVRTDRRSVKAVLDEIFDRRRLCGYFVTATESGGELDVSVNVFTFTDTEITLPNRGFIPANPNTVSLTAESAPQVSSLVTRRMMSHVFDVIRVEGQPVTSTATLHFGDPIAEGWTTAQQTAYTELGESAPENTIRRSADEYRDVFSRFPINWQWGLRVNRGGYPTPCYIAVSVEDLPETIADADVVDIFDLTKATKPNLWHIGKLLPPWLSLLDGTTNENRRPFVLMYDNGKYCYAEALNYAGSQRHFACNLQMLPEFPGVRLVVRPAGGQQLIAVGTWNDDTPGPTENELDPNIASNRAVDYFDMLATVTFQWDERVYVEVETSVRDPSLGQTLIIQQPDSRLDFTLPGCATDVDDDGTLVESDGAVIRDDRPRMREVAEAAAQWYGAIRQTIDVKYSESIPIVTPGKLITDFTLGASSEEILTPVTSVVFDFVRGVGSFQTSYTEADFT